MNQEEQLAHTHQYQLNIRNLATEYTDVEEYFYNMKRSNPQHELNNSRSWTKDDFEQLFA